MYGPLWAVAAPGNDKRERAAYGLKDREFRNRLLAKLLDGSEKRIRGEIAEGVVCIS